MASSSPNREIRLKLDNRRGMIGGGIALQGKINVSSPPIVPASPLYNLYLLYL